MDTQMSNRTKKLPFKRRVQQVFADLFTAKNVLSVPDTCELPASIDKRKNDLVDEFYTQRAAMWRFFKAHTLKQCAEVEQKSARAGVCEQLGIDEEKVEPGEERIYTRGDVSLLLKVNNPARRLDREQLRMVLITKYKFTSDKADECIRESEKEGKPPIYLTPTVNE